MTCPRHRPPLGQVLQLLLGPLPAAAAKSARVRRVPGHGPLGRSFRSGCSKLNLLEEPFWTPPVLFDGCAGVSPRRFRSEVVVLGRKHRSHRQAIIGRPQKKLKRLGALCKEDAENPVIAGINQYLQLKCVKTRPPNQDFPTFS